jgi:hypothetical protein
MELRTDRLGVLVDQFESSRDQALARLDGLTDEEYQWEPVAGAWSVRARGAAVGRDAFGAGDWVLDHERSGDPFAPGPFTTIAWRLGHLISGFEGRWHWTFGARSTPPEELVAFTPSAAEALGQFRDVLARWHAGITALTDEQLDTVGFGQYPKGLDPQIPFIGIIWWTNKELIHHAAEIGVLRDLWTAGGATAHSRSSD